MEWSWSWFSFILGAFAGANSILIVVAMLNISTQDIEDE